MALSVEEFQALVAASGLLSEAELRAKRALHRPRSAREFAQRLVREELLTRYQALMIYKGRGSELTLGEYVIQSQLGAGGMGLVFKALHRTLNRVVALKILPKSALSSDELVRRFHREMRAMARLSHPNIVAAHDAGKHNGVHYLVMEYVEGKDLSALVHQQGPLSLAEAANCVLQSAEGLRYVHDRGVTHRDIKPSNLLLDQVGCVKILDLGLARVEQLKDDSSTEEDITETGLILGSFDYLAPEQAEHFKLADHRADVYSLGCTLYFLLTGRPVYPGKSPIQKVLAHRESPIPSLRTEAPDAPESLDRLFQQMLAKSPTDRLQSMIEVHRRLLQAVPDALSCRVVLDRNRLSPTVAGTQEPSAMLREALVDSVSGSESQHTEPEGEADPGSGEAPSEFETAQWILSQGGTLVVREAETPGRIVNVYNLGELTDQACSVLQCSFPAGWNFGKEPAHRLQQLPHLRNLLLHGAVVEADAFPHLQTLPNLKSLDLAGAHIPKAAFNQLFELRQLQGLNVADAGVTDDVLAGLGQLPDLRLLSLDENQKITSIGLRRLRGLERLESLFLSKTATIDIGLATVAAGLPRLTCLAVACTPITDNAARSLVALTELRELNLAGTRISDRGLQMLGELKRLKHLNLTGSRVTPTGAARFRHKHPECEVEAFPQPSAPAGVEE